MWLLLAGGDYYPPWVKPWVAVVVSRCSEVGEAEPGVDPLKSQRRQEHLEEDWGSPEPVLELGQVDCL